MLKQHNPISTYRSGVQPRPVRIEIKLDTQPTYYDVLRALVAFAVAGSGIAFSGFELAAWVTDYLINHGFISL